MNQQQQLIATLGIQHLDQEEQMNLLDQLQLRIGAALSKDLSEAQQHEYQQIIDGHDEVIAAWLQANEPQYKETVAYQELAKGYDQDPDKVPADKVYASMAWVAHNVPNIEKIVAEQTEIFKAELASRLS